MKPYITRDIIKSQLANLKQITFEVTDACNLKCRYCGYGELYNDYDLRQNKEISLSSAIKLIDYLVELWNSNRNQSTKQNVYISFYGGEPLLNMSFISAIVHYVKSVECSCRNFTFSMTTNAILLEQNMDFLVIHDFNLLISLDGNEHNTSYRVNKAGEPAFTNIIKNVDALQDKYPDYFKQKVNFNAVLHNQNSVKEIYEFFKERYNKIPSISELNTMGIRSDKIALFKKTYKNISQSLHQAENYEEIEHDMFLRSATYQSITTFIHQYSGFVFKNYVDLLLGKPKKIIPTGTCIPFGKRLFMTVNGKLLPCEKIGQQYALGTVSDTAVTLDLDFIAEKYNIYFSKLEKQCGQCYNADACVQCIFNLHDLDGYPKCHGFMNQKVFNLYKEKQMDFLRQHPEEYHRIMEEVIIS